MDPYKILGISPEASEDEIKKAYKELAKKYHPDQYENNPLSDMALEKMKEINAAYDEAIKRVRGTGYDESSGNRQSYAGAYGRIRSDISAGQLDRADVALDYIPEGQRDGEWYFLKGSVLYKRGWYSEAFRFFSTAHTMDPDNGEFRAAYENAQKQPQGYNPYAGQYSNGPRTGRRSSGDDCSICNICSALICADCCCECMGGDCIRCI